MLRNAIAQEIPTILAPAVAHSVSDYYAYFIATCLVIVAVNIIYGWWKK